MQAPELFLIFIRPLNRLGIPYVVTGSTAAMIYGEPRLTHDIDVVIDLAQNRLDDFIAAFPNPQFYLPPSEIIITEIKRAQRGHFNIIEHESGFKADMYLAGNAELHQWAIENGREYDIGQDKIRIAPVEYVVVRKLEYYKEGKSSKHLEDIRKIFEANAESINQKILGEYISKLGLNEEWKLVSR